MTEDTQKKNADLLLNCFHRTCDLGRNLKSYGLYEINQAEYERYRASIEKIIALAREKRNFSGVDILIKNSDIENYLAQKENEFKSNSTRQAGKIIVEKRKDGLFQPKYVFDDKTEKD